VGVSERALMSQRAVFLDRDGVLNRAFPDGRSTRPPRGLAELEILPGVAEALARLHAAGFVLVGVSNQPDVARGLSEVAAVEALNSELKARLPLADILTCLHDDADRCACRKPLPGLLLEAAQRFGLDVARSFMVGDRWSDVVAGQAAGCESSLLVEGPFSQSERCRPAWRGDGLPAAADWILGRATRP
jgi:D-glycero-D-manno-heptose 1,7-bisphosphate phosphatase